MLGVLLRDWCSSWHSIGKLLLGVETARVDDDVLRRVEGRLLEVTKRLEELLQELDTGDDAPDRAIE